MSLFEIILIGIGLSMDAAAVSMTNGMCSHDGQRSKLLAMPLFFGGFQALMPLVGFCAGSLFSHIIETYSGIVILIILGLIGGKMIYDGARGEGENKCFRLTYKTLFAQAIATSIDAFAVGVGFSTLNQSILSVVSVIGITTLIISFVALLIGRKFGDFLGDKAQILGGVILIAIGIKGLF